MGTPERNPFERHDFELFHEIWFSLLNKLLINNNPGARQYGMALDILIYNFVKHILMTQSTFYLFHILDLGKLVRLCTIIYTKTLIHSVSRLIAIFLYL